MKTAQLEQECRTYALYLIRQDPSPYVVAKYTDYHQRFPGFESGGFDRFLVRWSARGPFLARLADSYASRFRKGAAVRKKLVLTLALLESSSPAFEQLDRPGRGGLVALAYHAAVYAITLLLSTLLLLPIDLLSRGRR